MKKRMLGAAICAATIFGTGGAAFAGEVNGKGESTPIRDENVPNSICAFSGLQDGPGLDPDVKNHVQTPKGEPDFGLEFPAGSASICQWINNGATKSQRPQTPPPPPEE